MQHGCWIHHTVCTHAFSFLLLFSFPPLFPLSRFSSHRALPACFLPLSLTVDVLLQCVQSLFVSCIRPMILSCCLILPHRFPYVSPYLSSCLLPTPPDGFLSLFSLYLTFQSPRNSASRQLIEQLAPDELSFGVHVSNNCIRSSGFAKIPSPSFLHSLSLSIFARFPPPPPL